MEQINMLSDKNNIEKSIERIKTFEPQDGYYLAFSGGKDSICCYELLKMANVKFDAHYNITGIDPPELVYFIKDNYKDVKFKMHNRSIYKLIEKKLMPPTRLVRYCCEELKEHGGEGRFVVTGVRWAESSKRKNSRSAIENFHRNKKYRFHTDDNDEGRMMIENCIKKGKLILNPIINWSDEEVWNFIKLNNLKYPKLYDEGYKRLGCIGCPSSGQHGREREFERYPKFKTNYIKAFERMLKAREIKGKKTIWESGEDVFNWWMEYDKENKFKQIENQIRMEGDF